MMVIVVTHDMHTAETTNKHQRESVYWLIIGLHSY